MVFEMKNKELLPLIHLMVFFTIITVLIFVGFWYLVYSPDITDMLENSCEEYDMIYVYRNKGQHCLDENNILYPIYSECPKKMTKDGICEIRFIQNK